MDLSRFVTVARELSAVVFSAATILVLQTGVGPTVQHDSFANKVLVLTPVAIWLHPVILVLSEKSAWIIGSSSRNVDDIYSYYFLACTLIYKFIARLI